MRGVQAALARCRFVLRCSAAAALAYGAAAFVGLPYPVWAPISALVVSQEKASATMASVSGRFLGTLIGAAVALVVHGVGMIVGISPIIQIAVAVAICATVTMGRPTIRVCLWTCPLVLVTTPSGPAPEMLALFRGSEVILGAAIGGLMQIVDERGPFALVARMRRSLALQR